MALKPTQALSSHLLQPKEHFNPIITHKKGTATKRSIIWDTLPQYFKVPLLPTTNSHVDCCAHASPPDKSLMETRAALLKHNNLPDWSLSANKVKIICSSEHSFLFAFAQNSVQCSRESHNAFKHWQRQNSNRGFWKFYILVAQNPPKQRSTK